MSEETERIVEGENRRFCGRCQSWLPDVIELHHCVKAPRDTKWFAYAWYEPDEFAFEKNSISDARPFKCGELIASFPSERSE